MDLERRERDQDGGGAKAKRGREEEDYDGVKVPADEEVEEFFATLKRIHVAVKYFRERNGGRELTAGPRSLDFERDDFRGVERVCERSAGNRRVELDLNSDPVCDASDLGN